LFKDLQAKIEEMRDRLHKINWPAEKEKLLAESKKLDQLIVEYYKLQHPGTRAGKPGCSP